jgi:hypothetical protein
MKALGKTVIGGGALFLSVFSAASVAQAVTPTIVTWDRITGIILPNNVVGGITGGGSPWSTTSGHATVDLTNSLMAFYVTGLVLAGSNPIGTTGPVTSVSGTLVCNPSAKKPKIISTAPVPLDAQGNAGFIGSVSSATATCKLANGIAFLITVPVSPPLWIANGSVATSP